MKDMSLATKVSFFLADHILQKNIKSLEELPQSFETAQQTMEDCLNLDLDQKQKRKAVYWIDRYLAELNLLEAQIQEFRAWLEKKKKILKEELV